MANNMLDDAISKSGFLSESELVEIFEKFYVAKEKDVTGSFTQKVNDLKRAISTIEPIALTTPDSSRQLKKIYNLSNELTQQSKKDFNEVFSNELTLQSKKDFLTVFDAIQQHNLALKRLYEATPTQRAECLVNYFINQANQLLSRYSESNKITLDNAPSFGDASDMIKKLQSLSESDHYQQNKNTIENLFNRFNQINNEFKKQYPIPLTEEMEKDKDYQFIEVKRDQPPVSVAKEKQEKQQEQESTDEQEKKISEEDSPPFTETQSPDSDDDESQDDITVIEDEEKIEEKEQKKHQEQPAVMQEVKAEPQQKPTITLPGKFSEQHQQTIQTFASNLQKLVSGTEKAEDNLRQKTRREMTEYVNQVADSLNQESIRLVMLDLNLDHYIDNDRGKQEERGQTHKNNTDFYNRLSSYVSIDILKSEVTQQKSAELYTLKENQSVVMQVTKVAYWIAVAEELLERGDYNAAFAVYGGLSANRVDRLIYLWKQLPEDITRPFEKLNEVFSLTGNYKKYRNALNKNKSKDTVTVPSPSFSARDIETANASGNRQVSRDIMIEHGQLQLDARKKLPDFQKNKQDILESLDLLKENDLNDKKLGDISEEQFARGQEALKDENAIKIYKASRVPEKLFSIKNIPSEIEACKIPKLKQLLIEQFTKDETMLFAGVLHIKKIENHVEKDVKTNREEIEKTVKDRLKKLKLSDSEDNVKAVTDEVIQLHARHAVVKKYGDQVDNLLSASAKILKTVEKTQEKSQQPADTLNQFEKINHQIQRATQQLKALKKNLQTELEHSKDDATKQQLHYFLQQLKTQQPDSPLPELAYALDHAFITCVYPTIETLNKAESSQQALQDLENQGVDLEQLLKLSEHYIQHPHMTTLKTPDRLISAEARQALLDQCEQNSTFQQTHNSRCADAAKAVEKYHKSLPVLRDSIRHNSRRMMTKHIRLITTTISEEMAHRVANISINDLLDADGISKQGEKYQDRALTLKKASQFFNQLEATALEDILQEDLSVEQRAVHIECWMAVASEAVKRHDYSTAHAVYSALQKKEVTRLVHSTELVSEDSKKNFSNLETLFNPTSNFKHYREQIAKVDSGYIPSIMVLSSDMFSANENNPELARKMAFDHQQNVLKIKQQQKPVTEQQSKIVKHIGATAEVRGREKALNDKSINIYPRPKADEKVTINKSNKIADRFITPKEPEIVPNSLLQKTLESVNNPALKELLLTHYADNKRSDDDVPTIKTLDGLTVEKNNASEVGKLLDKINVSHSHQSVDLITTDNDRLQQQKVIDDEYASQIKVVVDGLKRCHALVDEQRKAHQPLSEIDENNKEDVIAKRLKGFNDVQQQLASINKNIDSIVSDMQSNYAKVDQRQQKRMQYWTNLIGIQDIENYQQNSGKASTDYLSDMSFYATVSEVYAGLYEHQVPQAETQCERLLELDGIEPEHIESVANYQMKTPFAKPQQSDDQSSLSNRLLNAFEHRQQYGEDLLKHIQTLEAPVFDDISIYETMVRKDQVGESKQVAEEVMNQEEINKRKFKQTKMDVQDIVEEFKKRDEEKQKPLEKDKEEQSDSSESEDEEKTVEAPQPPVLLDMEKMIEADEPLPAITGDELMNLNHIQAQASTVQWIKNALQAANSVDGDADYTKYHIERKTLSGKEHHLKTGNNGQIVVQQFDNNSNALIRNVDVKKRLQTIADAAMLAAKKIFPEDDRFKNPEDANKVIRHQLQILLKKVDKGDLNIDAINYRDHKNPDVIKQMKTMTNAIVHAYQTLLANSAAVIHSMSRGRYAMSDKEFESIVKHIHAAEAELASKRPNLIQQYPLTEHESNNIDVIDIVKTFELDTHQEKTLTSTQRNDQSLPNAMRGVLAIQNKETKEIKILSQYRRSACPDAIGISPEKNMVQKLFGLGDPTQIVTRQQFSLKQAEELITDMALENIERAGNDDKGLDAKNPIEFTVSCQSLLNIMAHDNANHGKNNELRMTDNAWKSFAMLNGQVFSVTTKDEQGNPTGEKFVKPKINYLSENCQPVGYLLPHDPLQKVITNISMTEYFTRATQYLCNNHAQSKLGDGHSVSKYIFEQNNLLKLHSSEIDKIKHNLSESISKLNQSMNNCINALSDLPNDQFASSYQQYNTANIEVEKYRKQLSNACGTLLTEQKKLFNQYKTEIETINLITGDNKAPAANFFHVLQLFSEVQALFFTTPDRTNKYAHDMQSRVLVSSELMGEMIAFFCKAGKDRTGRQANELMELHLFRERFGYYPQINLQTARKDPDDKKNQNGITKQVNEFSSSREVVDMNIPGLHSLIQFSQYGVGPKKVIMDANTEIPVDLELPIAKKGNKNLFEKLDKSDVTLTRDAVVEASFPKSRASSIESTNVNIDREIADFEVVKEVSNEDYSPIKLIQQLADEQRKELKSLDDEDAKVVYQRIKEMPAGYDLEQLKGQTKVITSDGSEIELNDYDFKKIKKAARNYGLNNDYNEVGIGLESDESFNQKQIQKEQLRKSAERDVNQAESKLPTFQKVDDLEPFVKQAADITDDLKSAKVTIDKFKEVEQKEQQLSDMEAVLGMVPNQTTKKLIEEKQVIRQRLKQWSISASDNLSSTAAKIKKTTHDFIDITASKIDIVVEKLKTRKADVEPLLGAEKSSFAKFFEKITSPLKSKPKLKQEDLIFAVDQTDSSEIIIETLDDELELAKSVGDTNKESLTKITMVKESIEKSIKPPLRSSPAPGPEAEVKRQSSNSVPSYKRPVSRTGIKPEQSSFYIGSDVPKGIDTKSRNVIKTTPLSKTKQSIFDFDMIVPADLSSKYDDSLKSHHAKIKAQKGGDAIAYTSTPKKERDPMKETSRHSMENDLIYDSIRAIITQRISKSESDVLRPIYVHGKDTSDLIPAVVAAAKAVGLQVVLDPAIKDKVESNVKSKSIDTNNEHFKQLKTFFDTINGDEQAQDKVREMLDGPAPTLSGP